MEHGRKSTYDHQGCRCQPCRHASSERKQARRRVGSTTNHGLSGYTNHGCRCEVCTAANRGWMAQLRRASRERRLAAAARGEVYVADIASHGVSGYGNYQCRCDVCRDEWNRANQRRRQGKG